ncbi:MAG: gluconate 2-dehydrogenase subunit 3 family protein [Phenylobacterium sp.]
MLDRRQLFGGLTLAGAALVGLTPVFAQPLPALAWAPQALTPVQARTLDVAAELIIPATDTPGARAAGVPQFVDRAVATYCTPADVTVIKAVLDRMESDAQAKHGAAFAAITPAQQAALLTGYDAARAAPDRPLGYSVLKELVTVGFFTSEPGATKALRYDPVPGDYRGCVPLKEIGRAWATS